MSQHSHEIMAIDVHGHYGSYLNGSSEYTRSFFSADAKEVVRRAREANTEFTVVSPLEALTPRLKTNVLSGNEDAARAVSDIGGLLQWVVINPLEPESYDQADRMLRTLKCVGIKVHPEEHGYHIREFGNALFQFAAEREAVVLTHSGEERSLPADFVPLANQFPEVTLILAHIGCGWDGDPTHQVRALQAGRHGNLYADTSSASSIQSGLIEWAVREAGAHRILYGTDTPLYFAAAQRARIDEAFISENDKRLILRDNAIKILNLEEIIAREGLKNESLVR